MRIIYNAPLWAFAVAGALTGLILSIIVVAAIIGSST